MHKINSYSADIDVIQKLETIQIKNNEPQEAMLEQLVASIGRQSCTVYVSSCGVQEGR